MAGAAASAATAAVLYLRNAETALDLEANKDEVKVLTSLASVAESSGGKLCGSGQAWLLGGRLGIRPVGPSIH